MKFFLLLFILAFITVNVTAQMTAVPDPNFEQALINQGIDSDGVLNGQVLTADISGLLTLNVSANNIADLTGIEDFTALEVLNCNNNDLASLDVTMLSNLIDLNCSNNINLGTVDVSQNAVLEILSCSNSGITSLDLISNPLLLELYVNFNQLTALNTSFNAGLNTLQCINNQITGLDVTNNNLLTELFCSDNQLQGSVDLSQNNVLTGFVATGNSSLYCIQVADAAAADAGAGIYTTWSTDALAVYSEDCSDIVTYVPDDAFEQYLIDQGIDDQLDNYVLTSSIDSETTVDVSTLGVADLTGIEDFAALEELYCSGNVLTSLDVSQNTTLLVLDCGANQITSLTLNTTLTSLICDNNELTALDVSQNPNLNTLNCSRNQLAGSLLVDGLSFLTSFNAVNNPSLVCIQVDNETDATSGLGQYATWSKDAGAFYSEDCALSSDDFSLENAVVVYPNPASSEIHLELPYNIEKVTIHNILGQKMVEAKSETINISNLSRGLYFVTIQTSDNKRFHKKILVSVPR